MYNPSINITVRILQLNFIFINNTINLERLLSEFRESFDALKLDFDSDVDAKDLKTRASTLASKANALSEEIKDPQNSYNLLISILTIYDYLKEISSKHSDFGNTHLQYIIDLAYMVYDNNFRWQIPNDFEFELFFYYWVARENRLTISNQYPIIHYDVNTNYFTDSNQLLTGIIDDNTLDDFFAKNKVKVMDELLIRARGNTVLNLSNPMQRINPNTNFHSKNIGHFYNLKRKISSMNTEKLIN